MKRFFHAIAGIRAEVWVFCMAMLLGTAAMYHVHEAGLTVASGDQAARMNFARFALDSMTPGITQMGFLWRPLVHFLLVPASAVDMLYRSGLAGAITLVPCLALTAVFFYRVTTMMIGPRYGFAAALIYSLNPYVLYFGSVPMSETLFLLLFMLNVWLTLEWMRTGNVSYILASGAVLSLTFLCRIEGMVLGPIMVLIIIVKWWHERKTWSELFALLLMFGLLAGLGLGAMMLYGLAYEGSIFAFTMPSDLLGSNEAQSILMPREKFAQLAPVPTWLVFRIVEHASWYVMGMPLFVLGLFSVAFVPFIRRKIVAYSALALLLGPMVFITYGISVRRVLILIPDLPDTRFSTLEPSMGLIDVRYVLSLLPFIILMPLLASSSVGALLGRLRMRWLGALFGLSVVSVMLWFAAAHAHYMMIETKYAWIREDMAYADAAVYLPGSYLREHYDFGKVLSAQGIFDHRTFHQSGLPLDSFIQEANYRYFEQATREPWLFARWVVVSVNPDGAVHPALFRMEQSTEFKHYYDQVLAVRSRFLSEMRLYKLDETALRRNAAALGIPPLRIPSLNREITDWDPTTIYQELNERKEAAAAGLTP